MMKKIKIWFFLFIVLSYACSAQNYTIREIKASYALMDSTFNKTTNQKAIDLVNYYSTLTSLVMSETIGEASNTMTKAHPAYELVYFTLDVMKQFGDKNLQGGVDFALVNINGHRSSLNKGAITLENMYEIYSFDNELVCVYLKGKYLLDFLKKLTGAPKVLPSDNVKYTITAHDVTNIFINNIPLEPDRKYKIITLDYLAEGNDDMAVMKKKSGLYQTGILLRDVMISYVKESTENHKKIER